jgi:LysR family cyn operon transcriptional activator
MNLNQIRLFAAVAKHLNVTRTSEALHVSQSSISHQLARLQREFGTRLYKKVNNGIELTAEGRAFLSETTAILHQLDDLKGKFATTPQPDKLESLTIAVSHRLLAVRLSDLVATFKKSHPTVHITVRTADTRVVESMVLESQVDLAIVREPSNSPAIAREPYSNGTMVAFASIDHPLTRKRKITSADIARTPLVIETGTKSISAEAAIVSLIERSGLKPNLVLQRNSLNAVKSAVRKKMGIGIVNQDLVEGDLSRGEFKNIRLPDEDLQNTSFIIHHVDKALSAHAHDFLLLLRHSRD